MGNWGYFTPISGVVSRHFITARGPPCGGDEPATNMNLPTFKEALKLIPNFLGQLSRDPGDPKWYGPVSRF